MKLNLPNRLTLMRLILVPIFVIVLMLPYKTMTGYIVTTLIGVAIFGVASYTDHLDGKIARARNLITDFGKFLDPLADKFMVIGALLVIVYRYDNLRPVFIWATIIVIFRELAVTSMRLVVSGSAHIVIAANKLGKIKTVTQIICILLTFLEPLLYLIPGAINPDAASSKVVVFLQTYPPLTYLTCALMVVFTLWSGINYLVSYWKYMDPQK